MLCFFRNTVHADVLEHWTSEVLHNKRFITSYDQVYTSNVCDNIHNDNVAGEDDSIESEVKHVYLEFVGEFGWGLLFLAALAAAVMGSFMAWRMYHHPQREGYHVIE
jgi:hypothetical protein